MINFIKYSLTVLFTFFSLLGFSQEFKNEEDRKKHADKLFDKGKYVEASPHILHFLSLNQTSPEYNFKYGVCLMYSDEDKEKSLRYLKFSANKGGGGDSRVYFFLGKSYHLNYNFKAALVNYNKFKAEGEENYKKDLEVDLHIKMCSNGKKLLQNLTELVVYEKTESSFQRFQYSYDLKEIGGKILVSAEFQSKYDKKIGYKSVVYFPPLNQDVLFYSSYGKDGSTGLDLYMVRRAATGGWGDPVKLPGNINTPYDDAYGFLHADGKSFYFSSKGHNSMGGYDVFKVDYDVQVNQFGTPKNLDYKINTPDDDIMYIVDPNFENAYFSSSRAAKGGYLDVYKVKVETFPIVNVVLAGKFENKINAEDNAATIKVENMQSGEIEGIYNPDNLGNYIIVLPRSGKYKFIVETPESDKIHTGLVDVPSQKIMKPLKQSLALVLEGGSEKLVINNLFDEEVPNAAEIMAKVLKSMSDPDPNADDFPDSLYNNLEDNNDIITEALDENYSIDDLTSMSADKAKEVQDEALELKKRMEAAYTVANSKSNEAKDLTKEADVILKEIETISNPLEKQEKIALAKKAHDQSKDLNMLATTALNLANSLKKEYDKKQAEADDAKSVAIAIEKAVNENSHDKAIAALKELQTRIDNLIDDKPSYKSGFDEIVEKSKLKQEEADKANVVAQEYREADTELNLRLNNLKREYDKAKKKDKETIQRQIDDIKEQLELNDELAKESFAKSATLQEEADVLSHQVDLMTNLYDDIDSGTSVELTEEEKQKVKDYLASNELAETITQNENSLSQHENSEASSVDTNNTGNEAINETELTTEEKASVVSAIKEEFTDYESELSELTNEDEASLLASKKEITENWIKALDEKAQLINKKITEVTDNKEKLELEEQLAWVSSETETKKASLSQLEENLASVNENTNSSAINEVELTTEEKENIVADIKEEFSSYESELNGLTNEDEASLLASKKELTESWISALDEKVATINNKITETTDTKEKLELEEQLDWLSSEKTIQSSNLNELTENITSINNDNTNEGTSTNDNQSSEEVALTSEEKETVISNSEENYNSFEEELTQIDPNATESELAEAKKKITESWIDELDGEIMDVEDQLALETDSKNKAKAEAKLDWLKEQKSEKEVDLNFIEEELAAIDTEENNTGSDNNKLTLSESEIAAVISSEKEKYASFEDRIKSEEVNTTETEVLTQKSEITEEWISNLNSEINSTENQLENTVDAKEKLELTTKLDWLKSENSKRKGELANYTADIAKLEENIATVNENQITEENQKAEDWLTIIDNDINELDKKIAAENDPVKKAELETLREKLERLKNEKQDIVETNTTIIEKSSDQKAIENTIDYKELAEEIENSSSIPSDFEKSFTTDLEYSDDEAKELEANSSSKVEELIIVEQELADLESELKETKKEKKKLAIQNQIESKNQEKSALEIELGEKFERVNETEFSANESKLKEIIAELKLENNSLVKDENYQAAKLLEQKYIEQHDEANNVLKEAKFIENDIKKAEKLKEAHSIQQAAIDNQQEALSLLEEMKDSDYDPIYIGEEVDLFAEENTEQDEFIKSTYLPSQKSQFSELATNYEAVSDEEKADLLSEWKTKVDIEVNKNMKLLTSNIPDADKEVINKNVEWLRSEQQLVKSKIEENNSLAENTSTNTEENSSTNTEETNTASENTNSTAEENNTNTTANNSTEENGTNSTEENASTNTSEENLATNTEETNTTSENTNSTAEENNTNTTANNSTEENGTNSTEENTSTNTSEENVATNTEETNTASENTNSTAEENNTNTSTNNSTEENGMNSTEENTSTNTSEENLATNTEETNTTSENTNSTAEENNTNTSTNNSTEENGTNSTEENTSTNTSEENLATNTEETNTTEENNLGSLSSQKEVFNDYEDELTTSNSKEEKVSIYKDWITKIEDEIEVNEKAIEGNITVDEEALIESKLDWLDNQKEEKEELLTSLENEETLLADNSESNALSVESNNVSQSVKDNSKIKESVEGITFYSANENVETYEVSTSVNNKEVTKQTEFKSSSANAIVEENKPTINKVKSYETVINRLEEQKKATDSEKLKTGIDKKINKATIKKGKTTLKLADDFKEATADDNELANEKLEEVKSLITDNTDQNSYAYKQAEEYDNKSSQLENEASQLRNEAAGIKSVIEKNDKINEALAKEKTSIEYKEKASKLYAEAIVNSYTIDESELTNVSETSEERKSTEILAEANTADNLAYEYNTRAGELRDSANTVKKKDRAKVIQEAEVFTQRAEAQKSLAEALKEEGNRVEVKEAEVLENDLLITNLSQSDVEKVRSLDDYDKMYAKQLAIEQFLKELRAEEELMRNYQNLIKQQEAKALEYEEKAKSASSEEEKETFYAIAEKLLTKAEENREKQDSIADLIADITEQKDVVEQEQFDLLTLFDEELQNDIRGLMLSNYDKTPLKKEEVVPAPNLSFENLISSDFKAPEELTSNIVIINNSTEESVYSDSNPIPLNPKNPKGLVYKVQVGAFRKPIPQNLFKGFAPISAEKINDDITRYRVGYFVNFGTANVSKNQIRALGYQDAFVVAILNGKRISIAEARAYAENPNADILAVNENTDITPENTTTSTSENNTSPNNSENNNTTENTNTTSEENTNIVNNTSEENNTSTEEVPDYVQNLGEDAAEVNAVENIKGLFYTVQVGAFSKPISKTGIFNISPLVTKYVNGLYKYTTGIYKSVRDADGRKNEVRAKGIPDAFVIAYYNGEKVSLARANQIIEEEGNKAFANKAEGANVVPKEEVINTPVRAVEVIEEDKSTYYVDLGVYWGTVPTVIAEALLTNKEAKIKRNKINEAATQYYCGVFLTKDEVANVWASFVEGGITDANIVEIHEDEVFILLEKDEEMFERTEEEDEVEDDDFNNDIEVIETKLIYRVELGTYNETIPAATGQAFLELGYLGIEKKNYNNQQTYYCGKVKSESEAKELKQKFIDKGINEAKVVAFVGDRQISLIEAQELSK